jgi:hypothetical protein
MIEYKQPSEDQMKLMKDIGDLVMQALEKLEGIVNREASLVYTKAQEMLFWANNAVMMNAEDIAKKEPEVVCDEDDCAHEVH